MTIHDPAMQPRGKSLLDLFRRPHGQWRASANPELLQEIADFLALHRLEINPFTLTAAHDCVSGADPLLARKVQHLVQMGMPISSEWLRETRAETARQTGIASLAGVMNQLECNIEEFSRSTQAARTATKDYNHVLAQHGEELAGHTAAAGAPQEIVKLVRTIIDHTNAIEQQMARSERQSQELRQELDRTRRSADQDHLTGLFNRRAFDLQFASEIANAAASGQPLCVGFCDIDHFKLVNDTHGHDTGDRVIQAVANGLSSITGDRCYVARHGGEEFAILFLDRTLREAFQMFDEAREALAARRMKNRKTNRAIGAITISGGLTLVRDGLSPGELLREADEALYQAKREGRNRIIAAQI